MVDLIPFINKFIDTEKLFITMNEIVCNNKII